MPKGSPGVYTPVKIPQGLHAMMMQEIQRRENDPLYPSWTISSFIQEAIREKLSRIRDGRAGRKRRRERAKAKKAEAQATVT